MVGTRKTPGSPVFEAVDDDDDTIDGVDQLSVQRNSTPHYYSIYASPPKSSPTDLRTPSSTRIPSSYASPSKRPVTPPPALNFGGVPNLPYFRGQWVYVGNLERLDPKLSWDAFNGTGMKWLAHNDPDDLYHDEDPGPLGIILLGQLGQFTTLKSARNNFNKDKPEFSLQLQVEERPLEILKDLVRRRDRNLTVTNPLRVKVAEADITSPSFTPGDPFPAAFDGTTTDDDQDGDEISLGRLYPDPRFAY
ncbi:hypothetical protein DL98DRAFT_600730 [Cadophora sp. DSE1049]|nr:hypothetical protein DL98DRAFT_600730 [Cadophora sp. DSE1049]